MKKIGKILAAAAVVATAALPLQSAQAWWGGGPWGGRSWDDMWDGSGWGDFDMSMRGSGRGWGRGYNRYYDHYGPWGGGPYGYGYPGYGYGYPGYWGAPAYPAPVAPAAPQQPQSSSNQ
jgi:hypothetical protein